jgi:hypothetical protein
MVRAAANLGTSKDPENLMGELSEVAAKVTRGELKAETAQIWSAWR